MPEYRFYNIRRDGQVEGAPIDRDLSDDHAAINEANSLCQFNDIEIWQGPRVVAYVDADQGAKKVGRK